MSTSQPSPMRIRTVSSPSFSSFPRSGTLMSPSATCRTTGCPTQTLNALSIIGPLGERASRERESRGMLKVTMVQRGYRTSKFVLFRLATEIQVKFPSQYRSTVFSGRPNHRNWMFSLRTYGHDEARARFLRDPERERGHYIPPRRRRARAWWRIRAGLRASWRSASPRTEPHPHLSHRGNQRGQPPRRRLRQWRAACPHRGGLSDTSPPGHRPVARLPARLSHPSPAARVACPRF